MGFRIWAPGEASNFGVSFLLDDEQSKFSSFSD